MKPLMLNCSALKNWLLSPEQRIFSRSPVPSKQWRNWPSTGSSAISFRRTHKKQWYCMIVNDAYPYLRNRADAGQRLAKNLRQYRNEVIVVNDDMVKRLKFTKHQMERHAKDVKAEIKRRSAVYRVKLTPSSVEGKTAVVIDDGLASGYTMMAAIKSIRQRGAAKVVVAAPVASASAWELIKPMADDVVCLIVAYTYSFAVASFYQNWYDLTDEEVFEALEGFTKSYGEG